MSDDARSCPSCGARVPVGADACDLCGTPVEASDDAEAERDPEAAGSEDIPAGTAASSHQAGAGRADEPEAPDHVYCNECGWENPAGANYCSQCGSELQALAGSSDEAVSDTPAGTRTVAADLPSSTTPSSASSTEEHGDENEQIEMGRQILSVVGVALVLVLGLFFATQWSQQYEWGSESSSNGSSSEAAAAQQQPRDGAGGPSASGPSVSGPASPSPQTAAAQAPTDLSTLVDQLGGSVEGPVADQIDSLETAVEAADGDRRRQLRAQLVQLYIGAGAPGRAAQIQGILAEQTGRVEDRRRAANLLYKWMRQVEQQGDRARIADVARHVAEAYAAVVDERPEDLDARTRMGEAYMLTNSPMKGIQAINQVLADDSTFVPARFQKGLALLQINRLDQAVTQFQRVMENASQNNPFYQQAKRAIEVIREQAGSEAGASNGMSSSDS